MKTLIVLSALFFAACAHAQTPTIGTPLCGIIDVTASLAEDPPMPEYTRYHLRLTPVWITDGLGMLAGTGWNEAGDRVPITGTIARLGAEWRLVLNSALQTFDGRGYYVLSMVIHAPDTGPIVAYVGNILVPSIPGGSNDYGKPVGNPIPGVVVQTECGL